MQEGCVTEENVISILDVKINPSTNNDSVEELSTSINNSTSQNNKSEPVYVNSDVDNTYLKVSIYKVHLSDDGIRLSVKVSWNVLKDERQTEDWIGYYTLGLYFSTYYLIIYYCDIQSRYSQTNAEIIFYLTTYLIVFINIFMIT